MSKNDRSQEVQEDVCTMIKIIRRTLLTYENIMVQTQQQGDISQLMHKIASQNKILLEIATRNKQSDFNHQCLESIKIKIKEWLIANKSKYSNGTLFKDIRNFFSQLQVAVAVFQKNCSFVYMVTKIYTIICEHLKYLKVKFDLFHTQTVQNSLQLPLNPKFRKAQSLFISSRFATEIRAVKFSYLYGLEIDNSYLKTLSIQNFRNQLEGVQMQLQRNRYIAQQIQMHMRMFYLFVNRSKIKGKSRSQLYAKQPTLKSIRIKTTFQDRPCHNFNVSRANKANSFKENGQEEVNRTKMALKINNVYVSGNEFDIYTDNSTHSLFRIANTNKKKTVFLTRALRDPLISRHINGDSKQFMPS